MQLTLFGGVNEIGGNKILVEHDKTRFVLVSDFNKYTDVFSLEKLEEVIFILESKLSKVEYSS